MNYKNIVQSSITSINVIPTNNSSIQQKSIDGEEPKIGDRFFYKSKYSDYTLEGKVRSVSDNGIQSLNGVFYPMNEIRIINKQKFREEFFDELENEK